MSSELDQEQQRAAALLGLHQPDCDLAESEPSVSATQLGARTVMAFKSRQHRVSVSVYVFDDYADASSGRAKVNELAPEPGSMRRTSVNGGLLFVGQAPEDNPEAEAYVRRLASNFAGRERD